MDDSSRTTSTRSPVLGIICSLIAGAVLAVTFAFAIAFTVARGSSEPLVTGSVLLAFGLGWGLMGFLSRRFSHQPQTWTAVPAIVLGTIGIGLVVFQPGPAVMDFLSWLWPLAIAGLAIWMVIQVRLNLRGAGRWLVVPVIATLFAFAVGGALITVGSATAVPQAGTGKMVDVGGHRLYIECSGSGAPAVILQSGLGASSSAWASVAPTVAATTTVCAYDRAGHGRSDDAGRQDGIALATDLHTLLQHAGVPGPYLLVGHSSGGPYVRVFAARYPDEVAGMVLLDPQPADAFAALPKYPGQYAMIKAAAVVSTSLARIGLLGPILGLPADEATVAVARGAQDEVLALPTALDQAAALTTIGNRPLIIITAVAESETGWLAAQDHMVGLSSASIHRVMAAATHNSLITGVDASASAQAIIDVLASIRNRTALR
jgi:pimeloyl-ACP methyl ester carboxylesterase